MRSRVLLAVVVFSWTAVFVSFIQAAAARESGRAYETGCCTIRYYDDADLKTFTLRIGGFRFTSKGMDDRVSLVKPRVDKIMEKVQDVLDMHPSDMRISIVLYPDYKSLEKKFREFTVTGNTPLAFYANRTKTIYVDVTSITDGVLAHEMAHSVINFYFNPPPPAKMQEILAQYVDLHLWD